VAQNLLRPFGPRAWAAASAALMAAGVAAALALKSPVLVVLFVLAGVMLGAAPRPAAERVPLSPGGLAAVGASYLVLIGLHLAVLTLLLGSWTTLVSVLAATL
jgi:hypothetical protein